MIRSSRFPSILYLTWGATPRLNSVYGSQVVRQLTANSLEMPEASFSLAAAVPVLNAGLLKRGRLFLHDLKELGKTISPIPFYTLPIYAPQSFYNSTRFTFSAMHWFAGSHLRKLIRKIKPDIVHCRSYHAAWAAIMTRRITGQNFRVIFDARGLWPEEVLLRHSSEPSGADHRFRKRVEQMLLREADLTVGVSAPMVSHYKNLGAGESVLVPLSAHVQSETERLNLKGDAKRFIYVGSLSRKTWHKPLNLLELYKHLRSVIHPTRLTIVTTSPKRPIKKLFQGFNVGEIEITQAKTTGELATLLAQADIGLLPYFNPVTKTETLLAKMVFAVKTAEYLCAGLPVVLNNKCEGAAAYVTEQRFGIAYDSEFRELNANRLRSYLDQGVRDRIRKLAGKEFSYEANACRYADIYRYLAK